MSDDKGSPAAAPESGLAAESESQDPALLVEQARKALEQAMARADEASVAASSAAGSHTLASAARAEAEAKLKEVVGIASKVAAALEQITADQAVIADKAKHIKEAQDHADKVRADLDRTLTNATQQATESEGLRARAQTAADAVDGLQTSVRTSKGLVDADIASIAGDKAVGKESADGLKAMFARAEKAEARVAEYERQLLELKGKCEEQQTEIVKLLPGATSAGLAFAFDERRKTFLNPSTRWQRVFVGSVVALVAIGVWGLVQLYYSDKDATYDYLWRLWLARVPVAAALIWLALYSSRESALAKRLEEDYGYKAAVAASFQGFHKQMSELSPAAGADTPVAKLCADTLATIASPPGRIYDKHALTTTPSDEVKDLLKMFAGKSDGARAGTA